MSQSVRVEDREHLGPDPPLLPAAGRGTFDENVDIRKTTEQVLGARIGDVESSCDALRRGSRDERRQAVVVVDEPLRRT